MQRISLLLIVFLIQITISIQAQVLLPKSLTKSEEAILDNYLSKFSEKTATNPPDFPVRTMAEWEEIKAITLSWQGYSGVLTEIVREAVEEVEVIIFTSNASSVENILISAGVNTDQVTYINQATKLAISMVTKYGMSEEMGPVEYGENQEEVFLGRSVTQTQSVSEEVAQKIDKEIRKLVDEGYNKAKEILTEKIDDLHKIAKALMTYETLTGEEIENIINKNIYPADKQDLKVDDEKSSAMGAMGLKPKIVH